ncbi:unnamed protein product [Lupinus luteus]|uniref:KIB1-4 beta-propeller domain-containing protein n=1 Tax=Lupinus luteus TaxID=3873 RepID=A0AAV1Y0V4_LUPLU
MANSWFQNQSHLLPTEHYPWVVFPSDQHLKNQIFCSLSHPHKIFKKSIPELHGAIKIVAHCSDWLLLCKGNTASHYSLWNPTIPNTIELPPLSLKPDAELVSWALSSPPCSADPNNCMVLLFEKFHRSIIFIRPCVNHKRWVELSYAQLMIDIGVADDGDYDFLEHCVSCNGKLYAMSFGLSRVVSINVDKDNQLVIESLPCMQPNSRSHTIRASKFMAELGGELFLIRLFYGGTMLIDTNEVIDVHIFKLDFYSMVWNSAKDLMGGAIFFDGCHAFSCAAAFGNEVECDSIYFSMPQDLGWFNCFNLKGCYLQVNLPCPIPLEFCGPPMFFMPPSNVRLSDNHTQVENKLSKENEVGKCSVKVPGKEDNIEESEVATTKFNDLPLFIVKLIANSLNLFDCILNFRVASRDCWAATPPLGRKQALEKLKASPLFPWLFFSTSMNVHNFIDPKHAYRFLMTIPQTLAKSQLRCSKQCWMMMSDCENSVSFYNPFTKATIDIDIPNQLPQKFSKSYVMGFSTLPTSLGCIIMGLNEIFQHGIVVMLAVIGNEGFEWHTFWLRCQFSVNQGCPIFLNGAFYVFGQQGNLLVIQYEGEGIDQDNINWSIIDSKIPCECYRQSYILEWDEKIACVLVGPMGTWVQVFKFNRTAITWESVENLGDYTFFVSRSSCIAIEGKSLGMQNRIYFPRVHGDCVLYYSLETRKLHYDREGYLDDFHNTKEQLRSGWFDPRCF